MDTDGRLKMFVSWFKEKNRCVSVQREYPVICEVCGLLNHKNHRETTVVEILILKYPFNSPNRTTSHAPPRETPACFIWNGLYCGVFEMLIARVYFSLVASPSIHTNSRSLHSFDTCWISACVCVCGCFLFVHWFYINSWFILIWSFTFFLLSHRKSWSWGQSVSSFWLGRSVVFNWICLWVYIRN